MKQSIPLAQPSSEQQQAFLKELAKEKRVGLLLGAATILVDLNVSPNEAEKRLLHFMKKTGPLWNKATEGLADLLKYFEDLIGELEEIQEPFNTTKRILVVNRLIVRALKSLLN